MNNQVGSLNFNIFGVGCISCDKTFCVCEGGGGCIKITMLLYEASMFHKHILLLALTVKKALGDESLSMT